MASSTNAVFNSQKQFFHSGQSKEYSYRILQLKKLKNLIRINEVKIIEALKEDLGKSKFEAVALEIGPTYKEIDMAISNLKNWARLKKVKTPLVFWPSKSYIKSEPRGVNLIIAPWNYPFYLQMVPLVSAMAAGNTAMLKPSEVSTATQDVIIDLINSNFNSDYIYAKGGGAKEAQALLELPFDFIFFTGSTSIGKSVMRQAAEHVTPICLELGGKSPCIVDATANLEIAARRIVWGKFINAGQTCVAPDYIYAHKDIIQPLLKELTKCIKNFYGKDPSTSKDFSRIINNKHFDRLLGLIDVNKVYYGGRHKRADKYIEPTIINNVSWSDKIMQEEIFGPLLPIVEYSNLQQVIITLNAKPKPLALYMFCKSPRLSKQVIDSVSFGGGCVNDCVVHLGNGNLPFGGTGASGMGSYHGEYGFKTFSHKKALVKNGFWFDLKLRYPPFKEKLLKWL